MINAPGNRAVAVVSGFGRGEVFLPTGTDPSANTWGQPGFLALAGEGVPRSESPLPPSSSTDFVPVVARIMGLEIPGSTLSGPWQDFFLKSSSPAPGDHSQENSSWEQIESITDTISNGQTNSPASTVTSTTRTVP